MQKVAEIQQTQLKTTSSNTQSNPQCRICGKELEMFETFIFDKLRKMPCACKCEMDYYENNLKQQEFEKKIQKRNEIFSLSDLGKKFKARRFENWIVKEGAENASIWTKRLRDSILSGNKFQSLILWGDSGNGKTELAACTYNELSEKGYNCIFIKVGDLLNKIGSTQNSTSKITEKKIYDIFREADLIILDDLGTETYTEKRAEWLFNIIEIIYNNEIPSIITMNDYAPEKMSKNKDGEPIMNMLKIFDRFKEIYLKVQNKAISHRDWLEQQRMKEIKKEVKS